jgi:hypothetical protein
MKAEYRKQNTEVRRQNPKPQPMPPPIVVATTGWPLLADSLGRPLRRCREIVLIYGRPRLRGTAAPRRQNSEPQTSTPNPEPQTLQAATNHCCHDRAAIAGRSPGGRPLRRRREAVLMSPTGGCEGPQPSMPPSIIVATNRWASLADHLEGVRSVGTVKRG